MILIFKLLLSTAMPKEHLSVSHIQQGTYKISYQISLKYFTPCTPVSEQYATRHSQDTIIYVPNQFQSIKRSNMQGH